MLERRWLGEERRREERRGEERRGEARRGEEMRWYGIAGKLASCTSDLFVVVVVEGEVGGMGGGKAEKEGRKEG